MNGITKSKSTKLLSALLAVLMIVAMLPTTAFAWSVEEGTKCTSTYIETGVIPKYAGCVSGVNWFKDRGQWADNDIEPAPGMIIFFDWDNKGSSGPQDGESDHTGIVERVEDGIVYTVEGNYGDSCRENHYAVGYYEILGYGITAY